MTADKFNSDSYLRNTDYGLVGGISNEEINALEHELMKLIDFDLFISASNYSSYAEKLSIFAAAEQRKVAESRKIRIPVRVMAIEDLSGLNDEGKVEMA